MKNNYKNLKSGDVIVITDMMNQTLIAIYKGIRKSVTEKTVVTDFCSCTVEEDSLSDVFFVLDDEDITGWIEELHFVGMADEKQKAYLYRNVLDIYCEEHRDWDKYFTDSTYDDIRDWICLEFNVDIDSLADNINNGDNDPLVDTIYEITNYIWDALCKETDNYQACTDYVEPEMLNKQEFIEKAIGYFTSILKTYCSEECVKELIDGFTNSMEE